MIQNGIQLKRTVEEDEEDGMISNKRPRKAALAKAKLYGCFVKVFCLLFAEYQLILTQRNELCHAVVTQYNTARL